MKVIIAGSRRITDPHLVAWAMDRAIEHGLVVTEVVSGKEPHGVDRLGELWADAQGVPVRPFPAKWDAFGPRGSPARRRAGPVRNEEMACYAEALVALPDPNSLSEKWVGRAPCVRAEGGLPPRTLQRGRWGPSCLRGHRSVPITTTFRIGCKSRGTRDMIQRASRHKLWVFQFEVEGVNIRCWWKDPVIGPGAAPYF